jgi:nucleoside-diphosphate-sugar epimerase
MKSSSRPTSTWCDVSISTASLPTPILVTGGTGFLGRDVVAALLAQGASVRVAARRPDRLPPELKAAQLVAVDLARPETLKPALEGVEGVVHAAVSYGSLRSQQQVNVEGTRALARLAQQVGVRRFVHISTLAVYGYRHVGTVTEDTPPAPSRDPYCLTKRAAEEALMDESDLDWVILRPGAIYGAYAPLWTQALARWAVRRPFVFIGDGRGQLPLVHVDDVVSAVLRALEAPAARCEAFNVVHPDLVTWRDLLSAYAAAAGQPLRWHSVPSAPIKAAAHLLALTSPQPSARAALPELLHFLQHAPEFSTAKAQRLLDWKPAVNLDEGIRRTQAYLDWLWYGEA